VQYSGNRCDPHTEVAPYVRALPERLPTGARLARLRTGDSDW